MVGMNWSQEDWFSFFKKKEVEQNPHRQRVKFCFYCKAQGGHCMIAGGGLMCCSLVLWPHDSWLCLFVCLSITIKGKINSWFNYIGNSRGNLQIAVVNMRLGWTGWRDCSVVQCSLCYLAQKSVSIVPPHGKAWKILMAFCKPTLALKKQLLVVDFKHY